MFEIKGLAAGVRGLERPAIRIDLHVLLPSPSQVRSIGLLHGGLGRPKQKHPGRKDRDSAGCGSDDDARTPVPDRRLGGSAGSSARPLDPSGARNGLFDPVAADQDAVLAQAACGATKAKPPCAAGAGDMAAAYPKRGGFCGASALLPVQSGEARLRRAARRPGVFIGPPGNAVGPLRMAGCVSSRNMVGKARGWCVEAHILQGRRASRKTPGGSPRAFQRSVCRDQNPDLIDSNSSIIFSRNSFVGGDCTKRGVVTGST